MADVEQVYIFKQEKSVVMKEPGPWGVAYSGFCMGMAVDWCALRLDGKDYEFDKKTKLVTSTPWRATQFQNMTETSADLMLQYAGLKAESTKKGSGFFGSSWFKISADEKGLYLLTMDGSGDQDHMVAFQTGPGENEFRHFDPNQGLYLGKCNIARFGAWWDTHAITVGYQRTFSVKWELRKVVKGTP